MTRSSLELEANVLEESWKEGVLVTWLSNFSLRGHEPNFQSYYFQPLRIMNKFIAIFFSSCLIIYCIKACKDITSPTWAMFMLSPTHLNGAYYVRFRFKYGSFDVVLEDICQNKSKV